MYRVSGNELFLKTTPQPPRSDPTSDFSKLRTSETKCKPQRGREHSVPRMFPCIRSHMGAPPRPQHSTHRQRLQHQLMRMSTPMKKLYFATIQIQRQLFLLRASGPDSKPIAPFKEMPWSNHKKHLKMMKMFYSLLSCLFPSLAFS